MIFLVLTLLFVIIFAVLKSTKHPEWPWLYIALTPIAAIASIGLLAILSVFCWIFSLFGLLSILLLILLF